MQMQFNIMDIFKGINPNTLIFSFLYKYINVEMCVYIYTFMLYVPHIYIINSQIRYRNTYPAKLCQIISSVNNEIINFNN